MNGAEVMHDNSIDLEDAGPSVLATSRCWRCGLTIDAAVAGCSHCGARKPTGEAGSARRPSAMPTSPPNVLLGTFALLLATNIVHGFILQYRFGDFFTLDENAVTAILAQILVLEAIDTCIVAVALVKCRGGFSKADRATVTRGWAWLSAVPVLVGLLAVNVAYHWFLREQFGLPLIEDELAQRRDWMMFLALCVQPAVVEELYFRGLAFKALPAVMGRHTAVWISALMFGLAHIAVPLSMPYLILVGVCLGYLRVASGTVFLPICVHFVHNLVVVLMQS